MSDKRRSFTGPIEQTPWPERFPARALTSNPGPALFGYDVRRDLAAHYAPHETFLLSLTGDLPSDEAAAAFRIAAAHLLPVTIAAAPSQAACLARLCGASPSGYASVAAIALAEQARSTVEAHEELLRWLGDPVSPPPAKFSDSDPHDDAVDVLSAQILGSGLTVRAFDWRLGYLPALLAVLHSCGLATLDAWQLTLVWCRLPAVLAESLRVPAAAFASFPMDVPPLVYTEDQ